MSERLKGEVGFVGSQRGGRGDEARAVLNAS